MGVVLHDLGVGVMLRGTGVMERELVLEGAGDGALGEGALGVGCGLGAPGVELLDTDKAAGDSDLVLEASKRR